MATQSPATQPAATSATPSRVVGRPFLKGSDPRREGPKQRHAFILAQQARGKIIDEADQLITDLLALTKDDPQAEPCPTCKRGMRRSDDVKMRAIIAALDRAGIGPKSEVDINVRQDCRWVETLNDQELEQLRALRDAGMSRLELAEPIEAEVKALPPGAP